MCDNMYNQQTFRNVLLITLGGKKVVRNHTSSDERAGSNRSSAAGF